MAVCTCPSLIPKGIVSQVLHAYLLNTSEDAEGALSQSAQSRCDWLDLNQEGEVHLPRRAAGTSALFQ